MKKVLMVIAIMVCSLCVVVAQEKGQIVVYPFSGVDEDSAYSLGDTLASELYYSSGADYDVYLSSVPYDFSSEELEESDLPIYLIFGEIAFIEDMVDISISIKNNSDFAEVAIINAEHSSSEKISIIFSELAEVILNELSDGQRKRHVFGTKATLGYSANRPKPENEYDYVGYEAPFSGGISVYGSWGFLPYMYIGADLTMDILVSYNLMATAGANYTFNNFIQPYFVAGVGGYADGLFEKIGLMTRVGAGVDFILPSDLTLGLEYSWDNMFNYQDSHKISISFGANFDF